MKECKNSGILPCYRDDYGVWHYSDDTRDKVYELNKQMCDLGKTMRYAELMMDDIIRRAEENIRLYNDNNKYARLVRAAYESKFGKPKEKDIMKEKKTKKMTKAEAFEYLKHKKVAVTGDTIILQKKLFNIGYKWCDYTIEAIPMVDFLLIDDETFQFTESLSHFKNCAYEEISADDILSIEIVDGKKDDDERKGEILEEIAKLGGKISDLLEEYGGDVIVEIDLFDVILRNSGDILYRK